MCVCVCGWIKSTRLYFIKIWQKKRENQKGNQKLQASAANFYSYKKYKYTFLHLKIQMYTKTTITYSKLLQNRFKKIFNHG